MTKIGDIAWIDKEGTIWYEDYSGEDVPSTFSYYGPFTAVRLIEDPIEDSLPVVLDFDGLNSLGTGAEIKQYVQLLNDKSYDNSYIRQDTGKWLSNESGRVYNSAAFGFCNCAWIVLNVGAPIKPEPVIEPTAYGAQVEFDAYDDDDDQGTVRVVAHHVNRKFPWVVLSTGFRWNGYDWNFIQSRNPKIIEEG